MPKWQGKSKGTPLGYRIFIFVCKSLGVRAAYILLRFVALYFFLFSRDSSSVIYQYFRRRHNFGAWESRLKVYRNFYLLGQTLIDKLVVMAGLKTAFTYNFDGMDNLHEIVALGKGGILLSAHVGNWEMAGHRLELLHTSVNIVVFDGEDEKIKEYVDKVSSEKSFKLIVIKNDMSHVYAIGAALANNELVCMHADRYLDGNKILRLNFLGETASFPAGPFMMAAGFNVPVSIVFAFKEGPTHYHFFGSPVIKRDDGETKAAFATKLSKLYVADVEMKVKAYPEQWFNYYDFWSTS